MENTTEYNKAIVNAGAMLSILSIILIVYWCIVAFTKQCEGWGCGTQEFFYVFSFSPSFILGIILLNKKNNITLPIILFSGATTAIMLYWLLGVITDVAAMTSSLFQTFFTIILAIISVLIFALLLVSKFRTNKA